ncbi:hypothetical protein PV371_00105 [Streptomyces sp. TX20-6-3]|uniref:hypothetical protein n=1 Tax=Streptomyces sp. TX20-6-3 TaxID=3028705 RepID=UPI0029A6908C|nr:hypothetical protein [Streptomyces sp. TX20-6-3]MDX2558050.1 hypothetical protein [Streptomyces sp. TX20-6-3]
MRAIRHGFGAFVSVAVLLTGVAVAAEVRAAPAPAEDLPVTAPATEEPENFGASCRTVVQGSTVTAHCQNPYPRTDRIRLHVECERWWDIDSDSAPVEVGPADYGTITGRCWKEVRSAWITHQPADQAPDPTPVRGS